MRAPVWGEPAKVTAVGAVAAAIVTFAGLAAVVSAVVATVKLVPVITPAGGLVIPAILSAPDALLPREQAPPLLASVTVTVVPAVVTPVAEQVAYAPVSVIVGFVGIEKPVGKWIVIVSPVLRAPLALEVKPIVQLERAFPVCGVPAKVTAVGVVAAAIATLAPGLAATVSALVATVRLAAVIVCWPAGW